MFSPDTLNSISFYASKIFWAVFAPSHLLVIVLLIGLIMKRPSWLKYTLQGVAVVGLAMCMILPLGNWAALPLEQCYASLQTPLMKVDGVVVLGGALQSEPSYARKKCVFNSSADRVMALVHLMHQYPNASFVYSGGSGDITLPQFREADYVKKYLQDIGLDTKNLIAENQSRNTYENALYSLSSIPAGQNWLIVTSATHLPRAMALFRKAAEEKQVSFHPYPVDYKTTGYFEMNTHFSLTSSLDMLDNVTKEYLGLFLNKLMGKTDTLWPCEQKAS